MNHHPNARGDTDNDAVQVPRATLRELRTLVAGAIVAVLVLLAAVGVVLIDSQRRCQAGNELRRRELPLAFDEFGKFLGQELDADPHRVADARARFAAVMDHAFPERDCSLL